ncbi:MAG: AraC family transcriptional regulator ligand-binding domain-containing protein [Panacagrimonas sp.]
MRDSGQLLEVVHQALVSGGFDVEAIYRRLGYNAESLPLRQMRTPHGLQAFFWETVEAVTQDPDVGLHLCLHAPVFRGEVMEYLMLSSSTFGEGMQRAVKYMRLVSDALNMRLQQDEKGTRVVVKGSTIEAPQLRHTEILVAHQVIRFGQMVTEGKYAPSRVLLRVSRRAPQADYDRIFGCQVEFEGVESEIWFDPELLAYRSPRSSPELLQLHEEHAEKRLTTLKREDLIERIRAVFAQRLELERCDLEEVSRELHIPPRRLRFELSRAGTSFSQVLADFRFALARKLLARTKEPVEDIVYLTGFSEPSTFYRAFKRWSGMTPVQYRDSKRNRPMRAVEPTD